ncbi:hypothetical protein ACU686_35830 [Yinghuangia aomiensis]
MAAETATAALKEHPDFTRHPSRVDPDTMFSSLAVHVAASRFPDAALVTQDWLVRVADLNRRTMQSLLAGVSDPDSGVRLAEPETWTRAPGMPIQAQNYITDMLADHARRTERDTSNNSRLSPRTRSPLRLRSPWWPTRTVRHSDPSRPKGCPVNDLERLSVVAGPLVSRRG